MGIVIWGAYVYHYLKDTYMLKASIDRMNYRGIGIDRYQSEIIKFNKIACIIDF